jgi:hypothetical protein
VRAAPRLPDRRLLLGPWPNACALSCNAPSHPKTMETVMNSDEQIPSRGLTAARMLDRRTLFRSGAAIAGAGVASRALGIGSDADQNEPEESSALQKPPSLKSRLVGFMLAHEQFPSPELVQLGAHAERAGFDLLATSDHFQPWQANQRHAGEAWVTLGALTRRTHRTWMGPTFRIL